MRHSLDARSLHCIRDDWVGMSESNPTGDGDGRAPREPRSVLAELPRTRPQRASRRREAARAEGSKPPETPKKPAAAAPKRATKRSGDKDAKPASNRTAQKQKPKAPAAKSATSKRRAKTPAGAGAASRSRTDARSSAAKAEPVPLQGFEPEEQIAGTPVTPPTGPELIGSLAELAGELAHTGIAAGGRLLKGIFSRETGS